jgi:hypothetical protein
MPSTGGFAFTSTVRVIYRIHRNAAIVWALPQPARTSSFSDSDVFMIEIADLANRRHASLRHFPNFA